MVDLIVRLIILAYVRPGPAAAVRGGLGISTGKSAGLRDAGKAGAPACSAEPSAFIVTYPNTAVRTPLYEWRVNRPGSW